MSAHDEFPASLPAALTRHIAACNNVTLPGRYVPFRLGATQIGWAIPERLAGTEARHDADGLHVPDPAALTRLSHALAERGAIRWRDEEFDIRAERGGPVLARIDRGAIPILGALAEGAHVNGLVRRADGLHLWIGRRAMTKLLDPGKLDHLVGGGITAGLTPLETVIKEGAEEAGLPEDLARQAEPVSTIDYIMERAEGLSRDRLHCFDLHLPETFHPTPSDGEVTEFTLWPIERAWHTVQHTDDFKFNVNLVLIDLFRRHGLV